MVVTERRKIRSRVGHVRVSLSQFHPSSRAGCPMAIHIKKLKVRPRKNAANNMCATQLAAMLGCWAAKKDLHGVGDCEIAAQALFQCMRTTPLPKKSHKPTINYHLARLGKTIQ